MPMQLLLPFASLPLLGATLLAAGSVSAAEQQLVLRERLNQRWTNELLEYPFSAAQEECHPDSVSLQGPLGLVPVQLSRVEVWPGTPSVKSARLSFIADLDPLASATYVVQYGAQPSRRAPATTDLRVSSGTDFVELSTSRFGIRLAFGERQFAEPLPPDQIPGPVQGMRLPDGTWFGGSRLFGPTKLKGYSARIVESGPVFAQVALRYTYDDGAFMDLVVTLAAGDSQAHWDMRVTPAQPADAEALVLGPGFTARTGGLREYDLRDGWHLLLSPGLDPLLLELGPEAHDYKWGKRGYARGKWSYETEDVELQQEPPGAVVSLVPWRDWWDYRTQTEWTFKTKTRGEILKAATLDPGAWVEPAQPGSWAQWANPRQRQKWIPLLRGEDGTIYLQLLNAAGERRWQFGGASGTRPGADVLGWQTASPRTFPNAQVGVGRRLNAVKDLVLAWPEAPEFRHPRLFMSGPDLRAAWARGPADTEALERLVQRGKTSWVGYPHNSDRDALAGYLMTGSREIAEQARLVERLRHHLALLANYDLMRDLGILATYYDALLDSGLTPPEERELFRAQFAYLGYIMADPSTWSMERGYCSGNLNMSVSYVLNLGLLACTIPDHPKAADWVAPSLAMMDKWLEENVGPAGEWPESVTNYAHVSASGLLPFALAAKEAGFRDFINDARMKRLMLYLAKQYTPPDPRAGGERVPGKSLLPGSGRSGAGKAWALAGLMAKATAESDPSCAQALQWAWLRTGKSTNIEDRFGGFEYVYPAASLPGVQPDWRSELLPQVGAILRHGLGTEHEWYVNFVITHFSDWYASESGAFPAIFAKGVPISARFAGGYAEREELLTSRVHLARGRGTDEQRRDRFCHEGQRAFSAFSALPRQDYLAADCTIERPRRLSHETSAHDKMKPLPEWPPVAKQAEGPVNWTRQILFVKDEDPAGVCYLLFRDTLTGQQPTMWQFWNVSRALGTPEDLMDLEGFLAGNPGAQVTAPRELSGARFTAVGQFGVDTEFYVASPADTPRHTLRWGTEYNYTPINGFSEYMDLLHLQLAGDGVYYVALVPRRRDEPVPAFRTRGEGTVIELSGEFGADYGFLSAEQTTVRAGGAHFTGTAASVQNRRGELVLSLGAEGQVGFGELSLSAESPASLSRKGTTLTLWLPPHADDSEVTLRGVRGLRAREPQPGVTVAEAGGTHTVVLPGGVEQAVFVCQ